MQKVSHLPLFIIDYSPEPLTFDSVFGRYILCGQSVIVLLGPILKHRFTTPSEDVEDRFALIVRHFLGRNREKLLIPLVPLLFQLLRTISGFGFDVTTGAL